MKQNRSVLKGSNLYSVLHITTSMLNLDYDKRVQDSVQLHKSH